MTWDDDKSTASDPDNPNADEQLTADEWDNHIGDGHFPSDELNFGIDGNGDPVITDPQNADETVMRYDRSAGTWVVDSVSTNRISSDEIVDSLADTNGSQSFGSNDRTTVDWQSTAYDQMGGADPTNNQITIQNDGTYTLYVKITPADDLTTLTVVFERNGSSIERELNTQGITGFETIEFNHTLPLNSGDDITVVIIGETSGGTDYSLSGTNSNSEFSIVRQG